MLQHPNPVHNSLCQTSLSPCANTTTNKSTTYYYFNPKPSLSSRALVNIFSNFALLRYRYRQIWLKQVCAMGNLISESPKMETLNARFATPVAGMRSDPVTKVRSFLCIATSIRAKKLQNLRMLEGPVGRGGTIELRVRFQWLGLVRIHLRRLLRRGVGRRLVSLVIHGLGVRFLRVGKGIMHFLHRRDRTLVWTVQIVSRSMCPGYTLYTVVHILGISSHYTR